MLPSPPHPGARSEPTQGPAQGVVLGWDCAPHSCSPVLHVKSSWAGSPVQHHCPAIQRPLLLHHRAWSAPIQVWVQSPQGDGGKGAEAWGRTPAGVGGAHICATSCSPWDLLSADADGWRGATYCEADTGVSTIPPATASPSGSHHTKASADCPLQNQQSSRASEQLQIAMTLQQGQQQGFGDGCAAHPAAALWPPQHGDQAISDADRQPRTSLQAILGSSERLLAESLPAVLSC